MKRLNGIYWFVNASLCAVVFAGCSGGNSLDTEFVKGVVTMDGTPVPEATVMFVPVSEGQGVSATGMTDASGVYTLTAANTGGVTAQPGAGTLPGEYYVGVIKSVSEVRMSEEEAHEKGIPYVPLPSGVAPKVTHVVPQKYNNPKDSGIKVSVTEGNNDIPIELSSS